MNEVKYTISHSEIDRRIKAYTTLIISLLIGITLSLIGYDLLLILVIIIPLSLILFFTRYLLIRFFDTYRRSQIYLKDDGIYRMGIRSEEVYRYEKIKRIKMIQTTNKTIREIQIIMDNGKKLSINGLLHSDKFKEELIQRTEGKRSIKINNELLDYDHPLFYVIFGLVMGIVLVSIMKYILGLSFDILKIINIISGLYSIIIGLYFIIRTPLSDHYGNKNNINDHIFGSVLCLLGIAILISGVLM